MKYNIITYNRISFKINMRNLCNIIVNIKCYLSHILGFRMLTLTVLKDIKDNFSSNAMDITQNITYLIKYCIKQ